MKCEKSYLVPKKDTFLTTIKNLFYEIAIFSFDMQHSARLALKYEYV